MGTRNFRRAGMPGGGVLGDAAAADQAVNVRVQVQLLGPGVQHSEHGDGATNVTRITGAFDDRRGAGLHQHAVAVALIGSQHRAPFGRHGDGDGDVEVRHRQQFRLTAFAPLLGLCGVALGAAAIAAGMAGEHLGVARRASATPRSAKPFRETGAPAALRNENNVVFAVPLAVV
jgi:hypothetical protein